MNADREAIDLDLLIVGGGVQGLSLLHHYLEEREGSVLLVSRDPLGVGETLHSHGYLHRGYALTPDEAALIPDFVESFDWWTDWMQRTGIHHEDDSPVLLDLAQDQYDTITGMWRDNGWPFQPLAGLPSCLEGGSYSRRHGRRLVRIHDRLIAPWKMLEALSAPLRHRMMRGTLTGISGDPGAKRVAECTISTPGGASIRLRPDFLVLATGRETQPLLRKIADPDAVEPNRIRNVPMVLIKGAELPSLSGWFYVEAPLAMMTHSLDSGERMWVVTLMEGHEANRDDFEGRTGLPSSAVISKTLRALWEMAPGLKTLSSRLEFSSYVGPKIDHPEGDRHWFIGDAGIENLRYAWPVLWGLSHSASRELIRQLPEPSGAGVAFDAEQSGMPLGLEVGEELRLSPTMRWSSFDQWKTLHELDLQGAHRR